MRRCLLSDFSISSRRSLGFGIAASYTDSESHCASFNFASVVSVRSSASSSISESRRSWRSLRISGSSSLRFSTAAESFSKLCSAVSRFDSASSIQLLVAFSFFTLASLCRVETSSSNSVSLNRVCSMSCLMAVIWVC